MGGVSAPWVVGKGLPEDVTFLQSPESVTGNANSLVGSGRLEYLKHIGLGVLGFGVPKASGSPCRSLAPL